MLSPRRWDIFNYWEKGPARILCCSSGKNHLSDSSTTLLTRGDIKFFQVTRRLITAKDKTDKHPMTQNHPAGRETGISTDSYLNSVPTDIFRLPAVFSPFLERNLHSFHWEGDSVSGSCDGADPLTEMSFTDSRSSHWRYCFASSRISPMPIGGTSDSPCLKYPLPANGY